MSEFKIGDQVINTKEGPITKIESGDRKGMYHIPHWLYGACSFYNKVVETEENCSDCIHVKVCHQRMETLCENYTFGTSDGRGCTSCLHRYPRYDSRQQIPCFSCKEIKLEVK